VTTAFVLGGGGLLGAHEVGMLRALAEANIKPDLVVGTSIGAVNGAFIAADPHHGAERLSDLWQGESLQVIFSETLFGRTVRLVRSGTHLHAIEPLRKLLADKLPISDFKDLKLPFHCVAASIEDATARWFESGPLVPAVMASCAVPGLLPPVEIGPGRLGLSRSRSPAGTGFTRRCRPFRLTSACMCCPPAGTGCPPDCANSVIAAEIR